MKGVLLSLAALALSSACGDDGVVMLVDTGTDAGDAATLVTSPAPPVLTPCPDGWSEVTEPGEATICEPYTGEGPDTCTAREAHLPGQPGCAPLDGACPTSDFPEVMPTEGRVVYVLAGAAGGDGSLGAPYGTLTEALSTAGDGDVVAVGKGTYSELVRPRGGVTLRGACTAETILTSDDPTGIGGVVHVTEPGVRLEQLTVADTVRHGISVSASGGLHIENVAVDQSTEYGLIVVGASATATADGLALHRIQRGDSGVGNGIGVGLGAMLTASRVSVREAIDAGLNALGEGTRVSLSDAVFYDTLPNSEGGRGIGVEAVNDAIVELERAIVARSREVGLYAWRGGSVTARDVVVRDNLGRDDDGTFGCALAVQDGGRATLERALLERTPELAISSFGPGEVLVLRDAVIRDISPDPEGVYGAGLSMQEGAVVTVDRLLVQRSTSLGMYVGDVGTSVTLSDVSIADVRSNALDDQGAGVYIARGAMVSADRLAIQRVRDVGLFVQLPNTEATIRDLLVDDVDSRGFDGRFGRGIDVEQGSRLVVERGVVRNVRSIGVFAGGQRASIELSDFVVEDVLRERCADTTCPSSMVAIGLGSYSTASLVARRFRVSRAALCGVQVGPDGEMDLIGGEVTSSSIGACILSTGFDIERLTSDVFFSDNESNLDATGSLPFPEPAPEIEVMR